MLTDKLRAGVQGKIFKVIFIIIIISFIFTGVGGYLIPRLDTDPVKIGDYKISAQEWTNQYNQQTQRLQRQYGAAASTLLENPEATKALRNQILEELVDNVAYNSAVYEQEIRIGDNQIKDVIRNNRSFEKDGKFDNELYLATVRNMGMTPDYYAQNLRVALMGSTLSDPILSSATQALPYEVEILKNLIKENRVVDLFTINIDEVTKDIKITDDEALKYYEAHKNEFMSHAISKFNYIVLSYQDIADSIKPTDAEIEEFYNMHQDDYVTPQKRAAYQLVIPNTLKNKDEILTKVQQDIKANKAFTDIAKEYHLDKNTKIDLGLVTKGELSLVLDNAVFSLEKGKASEALDDGFSTTFVYVYDIQESKIPALKDIQEQVKADLVAQRARQIYNDKVQILSNVSYESPDSLDATAEALELKIQDSGAVIQGNIRSLPLPLNQSVLDAAFDEDNITSNINSSVITVSDDIAVVINVYEHQASEIIPFDKVKNEAIDIAKVNLALDSAKEILENYAKDKLDGKDAKFAQNVIAESKEGVEIVRGDFSLVDEQFNYSIFAIPSDKMGNYVVAENQGVLTLAILKELKENKSIEDSVYQELLRPQMVQANEQKVRAMLYSGARSLSKIEYNQEAINLINQEVSTEE